jgi:hypothetical protein
MLGFRAVSLRIYSLGHVTVIAVERRLIRDAVSVAAAASSHTTTATRHRGRVIDGGELLVEEDAARRAATDRAVA